MISRDQSSLTVKQLCRLYGVSRSGYYAWQDRPDSPRMAEDNKLSEAMLELHQGFRRSYGARRLHRALRQKGCSCSVRRITRLMKELDIKASTRGLYSWQPGRQAFYASTPNRLAETGQAEQAGTHWAGDFTYITNPTRLSVLCGGDRPVHEEGDWLVGFPNEGRCLYQKRIDDSLEKPATATWVPVPL